MCRQSNIDDQVYQRPPASLVAQIVEERGIDAACERWGSLSRKAIKKLAQNHRESQRVTTGHVRSKRRRTTPEQETAIIAFVFELGGPSRAAIHHDIKPAMVLTLLRERGITDYPRVSGAEKLKAAQATKARRRAERGTR